MLYGVFVHGVMWDIGTKEDMEKSYEVLSESEQEVELEPLKLDEEPEERLKQVFLLAGINKYYYFEGKKLFVEVIWGDWKHDHLWVDRLVTTALKVEYKDEEVTEEDGSDCYSSIHKYELA